MVPYTNPDTQMMALMRPRDCAEQMNSVHAATVRAEARRRNRFPRPRS
ncbi:MAG: hypothetical protein AB8G26_04280 [Ilumatobacter sp.]